MQNIRLKEIAFVLLIVGSSMAYRQKSFPKELLKKINDFRFDGTPSAKAMKAFDISYRSSSIIRENGTWLEASYIECTACEESAYTHFTYLWFGDDSCPDCENGFETSAPFATDDRGCGSCTIRPLKCGLRSRYIKLGYNYNCIRRHFYEGDSYEMD